MLRLVVLSSTLSLVFSFLGGSLFVALLEVGVDVLGDRINLLLQWGQTLNFVRVHLGRVWSG